MKSKKPICEVCGSGYVYTTLNEFICRRCGHRADIKKEVKKSGSNKKP